MANTNAPSGLSPVMYLNGTPWNGQARVYYIPASTASVFAIGDPVVIAGSADTAGIAPSVTLATAGTGNAVTGAIVGVGGTTYSGPMANPSNLDRIYLPASQADGYYVAVADDPNILFAIQEDSVGGALAATDVGSNFDLVSGTYNGYLSGWMLDSSTAATTNTLQLQLMGLYSIQNNAIGNYAKWLVRINNHSYKAGTAGV